MNADKLSERRVGIVFQIVTGVWKQLHHVWFHPICVYLSSSVVSLSPVPASPRRWLTVLGVVCGGMLLCAADAPQLPPLTTVSGSPRLPGKFIWGDLVTSDVEAARKFYGQLLGWTFRVSGPGPDAYTIALNNERPLCGMVQAPPRAGTNGNPQWVGFISVPNVTKAQKAVLKGGGREFVAPRKFPKRGEQPSSRIRKARSLV